MTPIDPGFLDVIERARARARRRHIAHLALRILTLGLWRRTP